ncbi:hypothetical protein [Pseudomonas paeninsulae]|uniref:hypothetical protein n=1 Tax=Pseudomonas paeninsulae TaxID=3110772 RepID=UPI002D781839|nr:hypothetical protein [Pseudomonas sp. IT1137]
MFNKIFIHAGLHKTGTSYLQNCLDVLSRNEELAHTAYPVLNENNEFTRIQSGNGEAIAFQLLKEQVPLCSEEAINRLVKSLIDESDKTKSSLLISSEHFSDAEPDRFKCLIQLLLGHTKEVGIIVCTRPLAELCQSKYHQEIKRHSLSTPYDDIYFLKFSERLITQFSNFGLISEYAHVQVINYNNCNLLVTLLEIIGEDVALEKQFNNSVVNRSLTESELDLLRAINSVFKNDKLSTSISDRWIYAQPETLSHRETPDPDRLFQAFNITLSASEYTLSSATCKTMIGNTLARTTPPFEAGTLQNKNLYQENKAKKTPQRETLLLMALEEINKLSKFEEALVEHTSKLKPTKEAFDPIHYLLLNRDVLAAGADPVKHFKSFGAKEDRFTAYNYVSSLYDV